MELGIPPVAAVRFQYLKGAIRRKRIHFYKVDANPTFNTSKVRLEEGTEPVAAVVGVLSIPQRCD